MNIPGYYRDTRALAEATPLKSDTKSPVRVMDEDDPGKISREGRDAAEKIQRWTQDHVILAPVRKSDPAHANDNPRPPSGEPMPEACIPGPAGKLPGNSRPGEKVVDMMFSNTITGIQIHLLMVMEAPEGRGYRPKQVPPP
ncbi:MAG: hypothetical protein M3O22_08475 [Pseudomonadota bacterium]|nr:hypothetical protein [Pseudomonadota bacterium]